MIKIDKVCLIGSLTGGTEAIKDVLMMLPENCPAIIAQLLLPSYYCPAILVAQHIPEAFSASLAKRLNGCCPMVVALWLLPYVRCPMFVCEASDGQDLEIGKVYIAKRGKHLLLKIGSKYQCKVTEDDTVNTHRPSVDVLFDSGLNAAGKQAMAVMLTGMGKDGAKTVLRMRNSSVVPSHRMGLSPLCGVCLAQLLN